MIAGNKKSFAVEFTLSEIQAHMGFGKVWIQNEFYGTNDDLIYFQGYLIALVNELIGAKLIDFEFEQLSESELFDHFESKTNRDDYFIRGSTFTDPFTAYCFKKDIRIYLIWKMWNDENILFSDLKDYGKEVKCCFAERNEIVNVKNILLQKVSA